MNTEKLFASLGENVCDLNATARDLGIPVGDVTSEVNALLKRRRRFWRRPHGLLWMVYEEYPSPKMRNRLVEHYMPLVEKAALRAESLAHSGSCDDAFSAGQVALMDAVESFTAPRALPFEDYARPRIWRAIRNAQSTWARREKRAAGTLGKSPGSYMDGLPGELSCDGGEAWKEWTKELPFEQRVVIYLHYVKGHTIDAVAAQLGISVGVAQRRKAAAIKFMRENLDRDEMLDDMRGE